MTEEVKIVRMQCDNCKQQFPVRGNPTEITNILEAYQEGGYLWCACGGALKRGFSNRIPEETISPAEFWKFISSNRIDPEVLAGCTVQSVDYDKQTKRLRSIVLGVGQGRYIISAGDGALCCAQKEA